ncbi:FAD/NAD(P)-binding protein [Nicoliella spurrieriana]|uniref:FAD/NAD(P)-binding protein n=1 Tax=Nicoliella spurrieriana TaxID=2925830 RepID=A0A976RRH8_9LACO|nr:FAD/NAD(P)-binding protein [Nicoliella spurrieriana]UQS86286.1 FAD/NAD(P)-binding protein [Nicoliella spurrieriana]
MKVGIIGAGPRGLITLSHLIRNFKQTDLKTLSIDLFDPFLPGGQVWRVDQSNHLIMNTIATDLSLSAANDSNGLNLYQWAQVAAIPFIKTHHYPAALIPLVERLAPNSYTPRVLLGVYAQWFYQQLIDHLPNGVTVNYHQTSVTNVIQTGHQWQLSTHCTTITVDNVVLSINANVNQLTTTEQSLADYAAQNNLSYQAPAYPGDVDESHIQPHQRVIIRGLGLSFFDEVIKMTEDRGGKFIPDANGKLTYQASGNEPQIFAGSRRGVPYYPKAIELDNGYQFTPHFLTPERIASNRQNGKLAVAKFQQLFRHEIELVYYQLVLKQRYPQTSIDQFTAQFVNDPDGAVQAGPFQPNDLLRWELLLNPVAGTPITTTADYQHTILNWMYAVAVDADAGIGNGPLGSALSIYKDVRTTIRDLIANADFTDSDYLTQFLTSFKPNSQFLSNGAPVLRFHQLIALMDAGIVTILGPQMNVIGANHKFIAMSKYYPKEPVSADALIEARIPRLNFATTQSEIIRGLIDNHIVQPATFSDANGNPIPLNAIKIDPDTDQVITDDGSVGSGLYVFSTLTEGVHWLTTVFPMVGSDDNHQSAEQISRRILAIAPDANNLM